jgi:hypothetical protein
VPLEPTPQVRSHVERGRRVTPATVESARLLANQAAPVLEARGLDRDEVRRLADE